MSIDAPSRFNPSTKCRTSQLSTISSQLLGFPGTGLRRASFSAHALREMGLPIEPVTLTVAQMDQLNRKLAVMRHDINNNLSLIVAALELIRHKPQMTERMMATLGEQPAKIGEALNKFSSDFERTLGITRP